MIVTYKTIHKVQFPVFKLPSPNWSLEDGLLFLDNIIVDDRNMPGDTLGKRRLQTPFTPLLPLRRSIGSLLGVLKQNSNTAYIDMKGKPFIYEKTIFTKLKYYRIKKVVKKEIACLLWVSSINFPFTIPRPPNEGITYAGVLHLKGTPWLLYNYSAEWQKSTIRRV